MDWNQCAIWLVHGAKPIEYVLSMGWHIVFYCFCSLYLSDDLLRFITKCETLLITIPRTNSVSPSALPARRNYLVTLDLSISLLYPSINKASLPHLGSFCSTICACFARYSAVHHVACSDKAQIETECYEMRTLWLLVEVDRLIPSKFQWNIRMLVLTQIHCHRLGKVTSVT